MIWGGKSADKAVCAAVSQVLAGRQRGGFFPPAADRLRLAARTARSGRRVYRGDQAAAAEVLVLRRRESTTRAAQAQARPILRPPGYQATGAAPRAGESAVGPPPDPGRARTSSASPWPAVHRLGDPARRWHRSGASPLGPDLAAVPARPGSRDPHHRTSSTWTPCCASACTCLDLDAMQSAGAALTHPPT